MKIMSAWLVAALPRSRPALHEKRHWNFIPGVSAMLGIGGRPHISCIFTCCLFFVFGCIYRGLWTNPLETFSPPAPKGYFLVQSNQVSSTELEKEPQTPNTTQGNGSSYPTAAEQEVQTLMKVIEWPAPPGPTEYNFSTSPLTTEFQLLFPRGAYYVGEYVEVLITARDHGGRAKAYGGDYFQAKLHSPTLKAGVTGSVTDHRNGTYTASFLLLWPGQVEISIRLVHSSEAIAVHRTMRNTRLDKISFYGTIGETTEAMECHEWPQPGPNVCKFLDPDSGERWYCKRQTQNPCSGYKGVLRGTSNHTFGAEEQRLLDTSVKEKLIRSKVNPFQVLPSNNSTDNRSICSPGLPIPDPSGFYYQDFWKSRACKNRAFPSLSAVTQCLAGKALYLFGDSTTHQWWKHLNEYIPTLLEINLYVQLPGVLAGPRVAVDREHNFLMQWQGHQTALTLATGDEQALPFVANELDRLSGEGLVVVINCMAHFILNPVKGYVHRLRSIRDSVLRLMKRSPLTKVFIKSGNTGYKLTYGSDWLSLQLDTVMRAMFSGLPVTILDNWQMTTCHYLPQELHPGPVIVKNEIDLLLSFICPT
eukprot:XP_012809101.1 PREDICTED: NXPE family member 3-like [Xenopus tropicalis]